MADFDQVASIAANGTSVATIPTITPGGVDRYALVGISISSEQAVTSVIKNSESFSLVTISATSGFARAELWERINPAASAGVTVVNLDSADGGFTTGLITFTDINQTTPRRTTSRNSGLGDPTVTFSSDTNDICCDVFSIFRDLSGTADVPSIQRWQLSGDRPAGGQSTQTGGASVTMAWAFAQNRNWDTIAVSLQAPAGAETLSRDLEDTFTFVENLDRDLDLDRLPTDTFTFTDDLQTGDVLDRVLSDSFTFVENLDENLDLDRTPQDSNLLVEGQLRDVDVSRNISDVATFVGNLATGDVFDRLLSDTFTFTDSLTYNEIKGRLLSDVSTFVEALLRGLDLDRLLSDVFTFVDNLDYTITSTGGEIFTRLLSDVFSFTEDLGASKVGLILTRELQESFTFSDQMLFLRELDRLLVENFTFTEAFLHDVDLTRELQEPIALAENFISERELDRLLSESFAFADAITKQRIRLSLLSDSFTFSDSITRDFDGDRLMTHAFTLIENLDRTVTGEPAAADTPINISFLKYLYRMRKYRLHMGSTLEGLPPGFPWWRH